MTAPTAARRRLPIAPAACLAAAWLASGPALALPLPQVPGLPPVDATPAPEILPGRKGTPQVTEIVVPERVDPGMPGAPDGRRTVTLRLTGQDLFQGMRVALECSRLGTVAADGVEAGNPGRALVRFVVPAEPASDACRLQLGRPPYWRVELDGPAVRVSPPAPEPTPTPAPPEGLPATYTMGGETHRGLLQPGEMLVLRTGERTVFQVRPVDVGAVRMGDGWCELELAGGARYRFAMDEAAAMRGEAGCAVLFGLYPSKLVVGDAEEESASDDEGDE